MKFQINLRASSSQYQASISASGQYVFVSTTSGAFVSNNSGQTFSRVSTAGANTFPVKNMGFRRS